MEKSGWTGRAVTYLSRCWIRGFMSSLLYMPGDVPGRAEVAGKAPTECPRIRYVAVGTGCRQRSSMPSRRNQSTIRSLAHEDAARDLSNGTGVDSRRRTQSWRPPGTGTMGMGRIRGQSDPATAPIARSKLGDDGLPAVKSRESQVECPSTAR